MTRKSTIVKKCTSILLAVLIVCSLAPAGSVFAKASLPTGETFSGDNGELLFTVTDSGEVSVQADAWIDGELVLPDSAEDSDGNTYAVTSIAEGGFTIKNCYLTGNLVIPDSVKAIGAYAFSGGYGLNGNLTLPDSVATIGYEAFAYCSFANIDSYKTNLDGVDPDAFNGFTDNDDVCVNCVPGCKPIYKAYGFSQVFEYLDAKTTYTVTYDGGVPLPQTKVHDVTLKLRSDQPPSKVGHTFAGWNTNPSGAGTDYSPGGSYTENADVTLYAMWDVDTYTIAYDANGGSNAPSSQTKIYGVDLTLSSNAPTRTGYTFAGWNPGKAALMTYKPGDHYTANAATTLYAKWTANTYTVSYDANGGSGEPLSQAKIHDVALKLSDTRPERDGYLFDGWNTDKAGTGTNYYAGGSY
jgi:uncharacterized repeat protein (TIGR02543 family)